LITITDFCLPEAFTPVELDGAICYTRLFLETVLTEPHEKIIVKIFIKEKSDSIYPDSGGFTDQYAPGCFNVVIFKDTRKKMISVLSHELVHVKQYMENGFRIDRSKDMVYWEHDEYMPVHQLVAMHRDKAHELYALLPWEHDANLTLLAIIEMVTEKFEALCKSDPNLRSFLIKAMKQPDYNIA
jgi:hypothetical protein